MTAVGSDSKDRWRADHRLDAAWALRGLGNYLSKVFDATTSAAWLTMSWTATTPAGTAIAMSYRIGNTPTPDASWTAFAPVAVSGGSLAGSARYVQFKVQETTTVPAQTPTLKQVTIGLQQVASTSASRRRRSGRRETSFAANSPPAPAAPDQARSGSDESLPPGRDYRPSGRRRSAPISAPCANRAVLARKAHQERRNR